MKRTGSLMSLALLMALLLSAGCAKKPVPESASVVDDGLPAASPAAIGAGEDAAVAAVAPSDRGEEASTTTLVVELKTIHFDFDRHTLNAESRDLLAENALLLQTNPELQIAIEGHCDERGSDEYNMALGERRAQAARDYLVALGVKPERVSTISYGEELPVDPAAGEQAWAKNRRAAFKLRN